MWGFYDWKFLRNTFCFLHTALFLLALLIFQHQTSFYSIHIAHFRWKPISVLHIWKTCDVYFLLEQSKTIHHTQKVQVFCVSSGIKGFWQIFAVDDTFHEIPWNYDIFYLTMLPDGSFWSLIPCHDSRDFEKRGCQYKKSASTIGSEAMWKSGKQNSLIIGVFLDSTIFFCNFPQILTHSIIHGWKAYAISYLMPQC